MSHIFSEVEMPKKSTFEDFQTFKKERPYKYTKAFTEYEWNKHLYEIWKTMNGDVPVLKDYIVILHNGKRLEIKAANYMNAKLTAAKTHNIKLSDIKDVL